MTPAVVVPTTMQWNCSPLVIRDQGRDIGVPATPRAAWTSSCNPGTEPGDGEHGDGNMGTKQSCASQHPCGQKATTTLRLLHRKSKQGDYVTPFVTSLRTAWLQFTKNGAKGKRGSGTDQA